MKSIHELLKINELRLPELIVSETVCRIGNPEHQLKVLEQTQSDMKCIDAVGKLRVDTHIHRKGKAFVISSTVHNIGNEILEPIFILEPLYLLFKLPSEKWIHTYANGGTMDKHYPPYAYTTKEWSISEETLTIESEAKGRSSNKHLPLLISVIQDEIGEGLFCGMEWSGAWYINFERLDNGISALAAGVKVNGIQLQPGETLRLPDVHLGFFRGSTCEGTNVLRRYLYENCCAEYKGEKMVPRISYDHWFGINNNVTVELLRKEAIRAAEMGIEVFVVDAGWFTGDFPLGVGNYTVNKTKFPFGLEELSEYVDNLGMGLGLWFEPERVCEGTQLALEHPDWLMESPNPTKATYPTDGKKIYHLNLARTDVQDYLIELIGGFIKRLRLKWSRWDYNIDPLAYWQEHDSTLKIQFEYMKGLYRVLDHLMLQHPDWMVEGCASGGRRIDIGTMKRAHTFWFSDQTVNPFLCRYMQARANRFLPGHLLNSAVAVDLNNGDRGFNDTSILSRMLGKLAFDGDIASWSAGWTHRAADWIREFKDIRHLLVQDFYQLTKMPVSITDWDAVQFMSYSQEEGVVFAFAGLVGGSRKIRPEGFNPNKRYRIIRRPDGPEFVLCGDEICNEGIDVELGSFESGLWRICAEE